MCHYLNIVSGPDAGLRQPLFDRESLLIGRGDVCGLRLDDRSVSRVQCRVLVTGDKVLLEDAGSRWGTLVNGLPVESRELREGDRVTIGDTELLLVREAPAVDTVPPERKRVLEPVCEHVIEPQIAAPAPPLPPVAVAAADRNVPRPIRLERLAGEQFLRFRVGGAIAQSASGRTFRALDPRYDRAVALKVFHPGFFADVAAMQRFLRAVRTMLPLEHPRLVRLYSAGRWRGLCFTASEFIEGESVSQIIQRIGVAGMLDWRNAWRIGLGVAEALEFAHERQIVHRNIRPGNILVGPKGDVIKLGDLVLARAIDDMQSGRITQPGELVGDLHYLAPEQVTGAAASDARGDIYSLGATMYAILTGRPPFEGTTPQLLDRIVHTVPDPPTRHHLAIPSLLEGIVLRMLSKRPEDRYASAPALVHDLRRAGRYLGVE